MAKKDSSGAASCKEDTVPKEKETESERALPDVEYLETRVALPSCQLTAHTVQETAL